MRYSILSVVLVLIFLSCNKKSDILNLSEITDNQSERPNILLIIADDLGLDACPGYSEGEEKPNMPNLDQLISEGIIFDNAWSYPLCAPTRASILTGRYGSRTGILNVDNAYISESEISIQRYLDINSDSAYAHAVIGKWHLSKPKQYSAPNDIGVGYFAGNMQGELQNYNNWTLVKNGITEPCSEYHTSKITDLSIEWINEQSKPWFCWLAYAAPHTPFHYPPTEMHSQDIIENDTLSMYLAMIESIDYEIGRLLTSLNQETRENTIIIFLGDNGTQKNVLQLPYRGNRAKGSLYQGGINVPLIISGKGVERLNVRDENLINTCDLFATIADIAGTKITNYQDSYSFKQLLSYENTGLRLYNFSEINYDNEYRYTITDGTYKLISNNDKEDELYKLENDPYERNNLYNSLNSEDINAIQKLIQMNDEIQNN